MNRIHPHVDVDDLHLGRNQNITCCVALECDPTHVASRSGRRSEEDDEESMNNIHP